MPLTISGKQTNIIASEHAFPEFPDMLFGTTTEGISVFDATAYLNEHKPDSSVEDFLAQYETPIRSLVNAYDMSENDICILSADSHYLIDGNLIYLFIAFVSPDFLAYMCDRINEMFSTGVTLSDSRLMSLTRNRFNREDIESMIRNVDDR